MSEILKHQGRLAQRELDAKRLHLRIQGLVDSIRSILDPFEETAALKVDVAHELMIQLIGAHADYLEALQEIAALKKALGRG